MSWLELTAVGRRFKLGGYQLMKAMPDDAQRPVVTLDFTDNPPLIPLAFMLQPSYTHVANSSLPANDPNAFHDNDKLVLQQASVFLNGKLADHVGCFCQVTYDGTQHHTSIDNFEVRLTPDEIKWQGHEILPGIAMNNAPTMSDVYNTTPVWGWPYVASVVAPTPAASTLINGGVQQQVVGATGYALLDRTVYLEAGAYRTADNEPWKRFRAGDQAVQLDGAAPYYRLALQHDWDKGHQSAMVGTFGFLARKYLVDADFHRASDATDRYRDIGLDAQYQYISDAHRFSAMLTLIKENQTLDASYGAGAASNPSDSLKQLNIKASYYWHKWYGVSLGYQKTTGSADALVYNTGATDSTGSISGSPNSSAWIAELNYLFSLSGAEDHRKYRLVLQYTAYNKFNGGTTNYDGFGRNAKDNNTLYLLAWLLY
ncbi:MAG TPA: cytochrome C [Burkholderiaceae bacterium]|nr:cytochrome C [Burkholderiaceae bacterium]